MDILEHIRGAAQKAAEDYLVNGVDMNATIVAASDGEPETNSEIVKRICELTNQNVYLSLFNNPAVDKGNIRFDMADSDKVISALQKSELEMEDYMVSPQDFRNDLDAVVAEVPNVGTKAVSDGEKLAALHEISDKKSSFQKLSRSIETMKYAEYLAIESAFNAIERDTKAMVYNGDSIADIAKIAVLSIDADDRVRMKVASVYSDLADNMKKSGFRVNTDFTKVSSLGFNRNHEIVRPAQDLALGLQKYAALNEMSENVAKMIEFYSECEKQAATA